MSRNWSLAVHFAKGEFITILGDDDGILTQMLPIVEKVLHQSNADAVFWKPALYMWPDALDETRRNYMSVTLPASTGVCYFESIEGETVAQRAVDSPREYDVLPMLYNGFARREMLISSSGSASVDHPDIFKSFTPDIYSGFLIAGISERICYIHCPLSIRGVSGFSNGAAYASGEQSVASDFSKLNASSAWGDPLGLPSLGVYAVSVVDAFLRLRIANDRVLPSVRLNIRRALENQAEELISTRGDDRTFLNSLDVLRSWGQANPTLNKHCIQLAERAQRERLTVVRSGKVRYGVSQKAACLNAAYFGVQDIEGASRLVSELISELDVLEQKQLCGWKERLKAWIPPAFIEQYRRLRLKCRVDDSSLFINP